MTKKQKKPLRQNILWQGFVMVAAGLVYGVGINMFIQPNKIAMGGVTGITLIFNHLWNIPVGLSMIVINIPLFFIAWRLLGRRFIVSTTFATVILSVLVDVTALFIPAYFGDKLLCALFGGGLCGAALGFVFMIGTTTGGTDILARLLQLRFPQFSMGRLVLAIDAVVVASSALVYKDLNTILYAVIAIVVGSYLMDKLLSGMDSTKMAIIITNRTEAISDAINAETGRGVTVTKARGWYSGAERDMLYCVIKPYDIAAIKSIVHRFDDRAFLVFTNVSEVLGEGFKPIEPGRPERLEKPKKQRAEDSKEEHAS